MNPLAIRVLESPDASSEEAAAALRAGPGQRPYEWLALLGAVLTVRPALVRADVWATLRCLISDPGACLEVTQLAGQALSVVAPFAVGAAAAATMMIRGADLPEERKAAALEALQTAVFWSVEAMDPEALVKAAEGAGSHGLRAALLHDVIEPMLLAAKPPRRDLAEGAAQLYSDENARNYLRHWLRLDRELTGSAPGSPRRDRIRRRLGHTPVRALIVHNINDGQGDEIARTAALAQALLDFHSEVQVVIVTRRLHLYSHPA
jgi:hypothetical protein